MPGFEIINDLEKKAIVKLFDDGGILMAHGFDNIRKHFYVREFEDNFKKKIKTNNALAVTSGTAAIKIALKSLGIGQGDEVITQSFNFIATIEAIIDVGAKPIIVNVDNTLNIDCKLIEKLITKKTKAILPVHMLGFSCQMDEIMKISKKYKLPVVEDNCEALGAFYKKKALGSIGHIGIFSFDFGKTITTGEGGMIVTNSKKLDKISREYHDHGHENNPKLPRGKDSKSKPGFNYRMTEMQGAIGNIQLKKLNFIIKENKSRYKVFDSTLSDKYTRRSSVKNSISSFDTFIIFEEDEIIRNKIIKTYKKEGFGIKNLPDAMEWHCTYYWDHVFNKSEISSFKKTKEILSKAIALPISLKKNKNDYIKLAKLINKI